MPAYFERNGYKCPTEPRAAPLQYALDTDLIFWDYLERDPKALHDFDTFMTASRQNHLIFADWFPVQEQILNGYDKRAAKDGASVLLVDIGGGRGQDVETFKNRFPTAPGRMILQDLPRSVEHARLSPGIEAMAHDFMDPQPIKGSVSLFPLYFLLVLPILSLPDTDGSKPQTQRSIEHADSEGGDGEGDIPLPLSLLLLAGARVYFFHYVLHNWPDRLARTILQNTAAAMEPGYSKIILNEYILPARDCPQTASWADMQMMGTLAALERSEKQWRQLVEGTGLKIVKFWFPEGSIDGVIELMLENCEGMGEEKRSEDKGGVET